ncbi:MAG: glucose-1-phosphate adenylyltransferase, partial [Planctomycetales bacterium]|nr:glucose-1-phosphate adenylyltransferase [Planctomycetales bacterium]
DAVRKNLRYIASLPDQPQYVAILSGDQLYRMDFRKMIADHERAKADVSIAAIPVTRNDARSLGVMRVDDTGRVVGFLEKPKTDEEIDLVRMDPAWIDARGVDSKGRDCLASMGIYLFNRDTLFDVLEKTQYADFGKEVFPAAIRSRRVQVHLFDGYWEDIGTIRSFYEANLSLAGDEPPFSFSSHEAPVYTRARFLPPTRVEGATIRNTLLADGCRIGKGSVIENSVIGLRCVVGENVTIRNSIVMGADYFETSSAAVGDANYVALGIGDGSVVDGVIVDKNCRVGAGSTLVNPDGAADYESDDGSIVVRDGIPVVMKDTTLPKGWKLTAPTS